MRLAVSGVADEGIYGSVYGGMDGDSINPVVGLVILMLFAVRAWYLLKRWWENR